MNARDQMLVDLASRIGTALVDAALVSADRKNAATAITLAELRSSPPADVAQDYAAARDLALGDDEVTKS